MELERAEGLIFTCPSGCGFRQRDRASEALHGCELVPDAFLLSESDDDTPEAPKGSDPPAPGGGQGRAGRMSKDFDIKTT